MSAIGISLPTSCHAASQCHPSVLVRVTYQCQSVPPISAANQCHLSVPSVPPISVHQCPSVLPNSASQCHLTVPVSVAYQCQSVPHISAAYQCHI
ncbi:unnamed protein product [Staurois parvus]|uniref:Uncharacterized protein n=1 Tax=Staurois parvus TaxID=386267 RepID=A0ABN9AY08_9NEOB|nr:unnamed protein product [Staurois parvus]